MRQTLAHPLSGVRSKEIMDNTGRLLVAHSSEQSRSEGISTIPYDFRARTDIDVRFSMLSISCCESMATPTRGPDARSNLGYYGGSRKC